MPNRAAWAEIDLRALRHNYEEIKKNIRGGAKLCAVVKADAYGHGALAVARVAVEAGASYLAVATLGEAIELREAGFTTPILLLGLVLPDEARDIVDYDVTQVVCELPLAESISREAVRQHKVAKVHLKVETGMGRIGIRPEEIGALAPRDRLVRMMNSLVSPRHWTLERAMREWARSDPAVAESVRAADRRIL